MDDRLKAAYRKLINLHFKAVQTDSALEHSDSWRLEKNARQYWLDFQAAEAEFKALLDRCSIEKTESNEVS